jgi:alpha/beta superfamily hydrolase
VGTRLETLSIAGPVGALEAVLQHREGQIPEAAALVCHPHPLYGGTLHNKVVHRVASTLHELGAAVLRFNFRGAGKSEGAHDEGRGELEDARAALRWLEERYPGAQRWLAGFSFGSWIAARLAAAEPVERLILVSPPLQRSDFGAMRQSGVPKLVLQGTKDDVVPPEDLQREFPLWHEPKRLILVEGASHFYDRQLAALADGIRRGLAELATPRS